MQTNTITRKWGGAESLVLAIGEDRVIGLAEDGAAAKEISIAFRLPPQGADPTSALLLAFEEIRAALPEPGARRQIRVILLPPLSEGKLLHNLPPLRREETEQVVRTTAAQHFLRGGVPLVVGVEEEREAEEEPSEDGTPPPRPPVLAAAAPRVLADSVHRAVSAAGWEIDSIIPAHAAWLTALRSWGEGGTAGAGGGGTPRVLVAVVGGTAHLLRLDGEGLTRVRRLSAASPREIVDGAGDGPGRVLVSAEGTAGESILAAFSGAGWHAAKESRLAGTPAVLAANFAAETDLEMVPPRLAMERRDRVRRIGIGLGIAAGVLFLATALLLFVGARMELRAVRQYREEIRPSVIPLMAGADSLFMLEDRVRAIEEVEASSEGWAFVLVELAVLLPQDTHLERIQAAGDTLVLEAIGGRAGEVLEALRRSATLSDPRLEGPIQRDVEGGAATRERFRLSAIRKEASPSSLTQPAEGAL